MPDQPEAGSTSVALRSMNDRLALSILLAKQPLSRNQLSKQANVSKPTASQMVRRLEAGGFIEQVGETEGFRGPSAVTYGVRLDRVLGVAVDIQIDRLLAVVVDAAGRHHPPVELARDADHDPVADVRAAVDAACAAAGKDAAAVLAVRIGLPASVASHTDRLYLPNALHRWPEVGARALLEHATGWSVTLANDVKLAAAAEREAGSGRGVESFALLWLGQGVGFATVVQGHAVNGARGAAGEIGGLPLPRDAADVDPGARELDELLDPDGLLVVARRHGIPVGSIAALADALDTDADHRGFLDELARRIAYAIPPAIALLDPEVIILGGPIGSAGGEVLADLVAAAAARLSDAVPRVLPAVVRSDAVLSGARGSLLVEIRSRLLDQAAASTAD